MMNYSVDDNGIVDFGRDGANDFYGNQLRNRTMDGILEVTRKPQNQLIAQVPVNMKEQQDAAAASTLGRAEMHINSDNPMTKYMMQVQNMIGKEVIGISAVSLKAFFALSYYYNQLVQDLKNLCTTFDPNNGVEIWKAFGKLLIFNPVNNEVTSLANIDIQQVIDVIENDPRFEHINISGLTNDDVSEELINKYTPLMSEWIKDGELNLRNALMGYTDEFEVWHDGLLQRVNRTDAALTDSGIISSATDNAKELILAKINATPDLVDIYTYLVSLGTPFASIAKIMTSRGFNDIQKLGEQNIFDEGTKRYNVKDMIKFYVGQEVPPFNLRTLSKFTLDAYNKDRLIVDIQDSEKVDGWINAIYKEIETLKNSDNKNKQFFIQQNLLLLKQLQRVLFRNESWSMLTNDEQIAITSIANMLPAVEEMSTLGRILGINQGQRTNYYELRNMKSLIPDFVNDLLGTETFDFDSFLIDNDYRSNAIASYETNKLSYNILDVLSSVPHFEAMLRTLYYSEAVLKEYSSRVRTLSNLARDLSEDSEYRNSRIAKGKDDPGKIKLSKSDFASLDRYINDLYISKFLRESDFAIVAPEGAKEYTSYTDTPTRGLSEGQTVTLKTDLDQATFKWLMDKIIIKELKKKYPENVFLKQLRPMADIQNNAVKIGWKLPLQVMDIDASPNTQALYSEILNAFDEIAKNTEYGQTIGDLFYIYNLITNKDSFGQSSMTRLFENLLSRGTSKYINAYNKFIADIDNSGQLEYDVNEAAYRILKDNPNSRVHINNKLDPTSSLGPDFTLDLPVSNNQPSKINTNEVVHFNNEVDQYEAIEELIYSRFSDRTNSEINFVDDEDIKDMFPDDFRLDQMLNSNGFVKDGNIYINIDSENHIGTMIHEFAHLVLASMKFGDNSELYYNLLNKVKDSPQFETYAAKYPMALGSDLLEEVFASMLQDRLSGIHVTPNLDESVLLATSRLLGLKEPIKDINDVVNHSLDDLLAKFTNNLLSSNKIIDKINMQENAKVRSLKERLFNDGILKQEC